MPRPVNDDIPITIGFRDFEPDPETETSMDSATFVKFINNRIQEEPLSGEMSQNVTLWNLDLKPPQAVLYLQADLGFELTES